ncbi:hypothetical protein AGLY_007520 [Aphis glycines]|uniref:Uncharacterized protein n=1 Tax=Aphis glycines TaxID=307491 RepID=A0A6G0TMB4_APHGL|nr:hypothetical protein AGLY_007520 [Aphis glycines]
MTSYKKGKISMQSENMKQIISLKIGAWILNILGDETSMCLIFVETNVAKLKLPIKSKKYIIKIKLTPRHLTQLIGNSYQLKHVLVRVFDNLKNGHHIELHLFVFYHSLNNKVIFYVQLSPNDGYNFFELHIHNIVYIVSAAKITRVNVIIDYFIIMTNLINVSSRVQLDSEVFNALH